MLGMEVSQLQLNPVVLLLEMFGLEGKLNVAAFGHFVFFTKFYAIN